MTRRKRLATLMAAGLLSGTSAWGTYSAFSSTTTNGANQIAAGTVYVSDNDAGTAMYSVSAMAPGTTVERCIKVTYTGTMDADLRLYTTSAVDTLGPYLNLTIEKGTGTAAFPGCGDFSAQSTIYTGTLTNFATTRNTWASGVVVNPGAATKWVANDALVFRFRVTLQDDDGANGGATPKTSGPHTYTWEARNQ